MERVKIYFNGTDTNFLIYNKTHNITIDEFMIILRKFAYYDDPNFVHISNDNMNTLMFKELYLRNYDLYLDAVVLDDGKLITRDKWMVNYHIDYMVYQTYLTKNIHIGMDIINRRQCIATLTNGQRCTMSCVNDNIGCLDHFRYTLTEDDIKLNEFEIDREILKSYKGQLPIAQLLYENNFDNPIKIMHMSFDAFNTIFNEYNDPKNDYYNLIKNSFSSMGKTIMNSRDYLPILCGMENKVKCVVNKDITPAPVIRDITPARVTHKSTPRVMLLNCKTCGNKFASNSDIEKCCSPECNEKYNYVNNNKPVSCMICMDEISKKEALICNNGDATCKECAVNFIKSKMNDGVECKGCPNNETHTMNLRPIYNMLPPKVMEQLKNKTIIDIYAQASSQNPHFYVCPFCRVYGYDMAKGDNIEFTTTATINNKNIELVFMDGFQFPFIKNTIVALNNMIIEKNEILISVNNTNVMNMMKDDIMKLFSESNTLEVKHEQICDILTSINKNNNNMIVKTNYTNIHCKNCDIHWCIKCNKKQHNGACDKLQTGTPEEISKVVSDMVSDIMIDKCPHCNNAYIKSEGCNLIHCGKCHKAFCNLCKLKIEKRNGREYWHFGQNSCPLYDNTNRATHIKDDYVRNHIKIKSLLDNNPAYKEMLIAEFAKHNININNIGIFSRIINYCKSIFKREPINQRLNQNNLEDLVLDEGVPGGRRGYMIPV